MWIDLFKKRFLQIFEKTYLETFSTVFLVINIKTHNPEPAPKQ